MLKRGMRVMVVTTLLILAGCPAPAVAPKEIASTREGVETYARGLYDLSEASGGGQAQADALDAELRRAFHFLGIPVLDSSQLPADELTRRLQSPQPPGVDFELALIAQGLQSGVVVSLDSLLEELGAHGFQPRDPSAHLTTQHLTEVLSPVVEQAEYTDAERPLALVLALGRERARRSGLSPANPVFGDDALDVLQLTLLMRQALPIYAAKRAGTTGGARQSLRSPLVTQALILDKLLDYAGGIWTALEQGGVGVIKLAVSVYGTKFTLEATKQQLWHQRPGADSASTLTARIEYTWKPNSPHVVDHLLTLGIKVPKVGPLEGKTVNWFYDDELESQGALTEPATTTDAQGKSTNTFTVSQDEDTPQEFWVPGNERSAAFGWITVRNHGLVEDFAKLEAFFRFMTDGGSFGRTHNRVGLEVFEYTRGPLLSGTITLTEDLDVDEHTVSEPTSEVFIEETRTMRDRFTQTIALLRFSVNAVGAVTSEAQFNRSRETHEVVRETRVCPSSGVMSPYSQFSDMEHTSSGTSSEPVLLSSVADSEDLEALESIKVSFNKVSVTHSGVMVIRSGVESCDAPPVFVTDVPITDTESGHGIEFDLKRDPQSPGTFKGSMELISLSDPSQGMRWTSKVTWDLRLQQ